jgi:predicted DNA-binding protein (MmcQ/YjbR family)
MPVGPAARPDPRTRLVDICLTLPEAQASGDQHVRFHVRNKTFGYYLDDHHGDGRIALCCKVPTGDLDPLVALDPERYFVPPYLGSRGWIGVRLDVHDVEWDEIAKFVRVSYGLVAPKRLAALAK